MKKTVTVSLNGRVFTMDEDAYQLLDIYLQNLRSYFEKEEGATEILADFEARIEELLSEKLQSGRTVVAFVEIEEVIARVGKPTDFATADEAETPSAAPETKNTRKKLFRNMHDKIVGGVCSGLAAYFGWDATWVRLAFVVLAFIPAGLTKVVYHIVPGGAHSSSFSISFLIIAYVIAWIVVPKAKTAEEKLQMRGEPVTVENIGKTVSAQAAPPTSQSNNNGCLSGGLSVLGALLKVSLIVIGLLVVIPLLFALGIVVVVLFGVLFGVTGGLLGGLGSELIGESSFFAINRPVLAIVSLVLILGIPSAAIIYWVVAKIAKLKPVSLLFKRISLAIWLVALALLCCSGIHFNKNNWMKGQWWKNASYKWNEVSYKWDGTSYVVDETSMPIEGNGRLIERQVDFDGAVSTLKLGKHLVAKVQIEQTDSGKTTLFYSGDENFVKSIREDLKDNRLELTGKRLVSGVHNLNIRIQTPKLSRIEQYSVGTISLEGAFTADTMEVEMNSVGNIDIKSLTATLLTVNSDGVGSVEVAGHARKATLKVKGVGGIDALELVADTVIARVEGLASIRCNPVTYLNASLRGIGSITYKDNPASKTTTTVGLGHVGKD